MLVRGRMVYRSSSAGFGLGQKNEANKQLVIEMRPVKELTRVNPDGGHKKVDPPLPRWALSDHRDRSAHP